jgi:hypothetical protein
MERNIMNDGILTLTVTLEDREDGGVRVSSADLPGLILSGSDKHKVLGSVSLAIAALLEHSGLENVTVKPAKSLAEILNGKNPQDVDMHVQHFVIEYRKAA